MSQTSLSVWFVCRLCRGSFGQVDAFIEHKKQKHFNEFQNTSCIFFEERDIPGSELCPVIIKAENLLMDDNNEPRIKVEPKDEDTNNPFSSEIIFESNLFDLKAELIPDESEINPYNENSFLGLKHPQQKPCVLLKRLTSKEIQSASVPQQHSTLLKFGKKDFVTNAEPSSLSADVNSKISDHNNFEKSTKIQPTSTVKHNLQFECKFCSKQLESDAKLKIHVGICALYHKDRNRFSDVCNRIFSNTIIVKLHRLRFRGTEEEKLSLRKLKCHVCPKQYRRVKDLKLHLESHKEKKRVTTSKPKLLKCSHPNCGKEFQFNSKLQRHKASHAGIRPFSCSFPNCNKTFTQRAQLIRHIFGLRSEGVHTNTPSTTVTKSL